MKEIQLEQGNLIKIGENAKENWALIDASEPEWWWFHLKSFPSSHVVLETSEPTNEELIAAATWCKDTTKYRNLKNLKVSYCQIKNIKKAEKVGSVTFLSNRKVKEIKL
tara:strand:- start:208 stop:534 length:327 start_codon:yes stop_codon:yes gene_type:complete